MKKHKWQIVIITFIVFSTLFAAGIFCFGADYLQNKGNYKMATFAYKNILFLQKFKIKTAPKPYCDTCIEYSKLLLRNGMYKQARTVAQQCLDKTPENYRYHQIELLFIILKSYKQENVYKNALDTLNKLLIINEFIENQDIGAYKNTLKTNDICKIPLDSQLHDRLYKEFGIYNIALKDYKTAEKYLNMCCKKPDIEIAKLEYAKGNNKSAQNILKDAFLDTDEKFTLLGKHNHNENLLYLAQAYSTLAQFNNEKSLSCNQYAYSLYSTALGQKSPEAFCQRYNALKAYCKNYASKYYIPDCNSVIQEHMQSGKNILFFDKNPINTENVEKFCKGEAGRLGETQQYEL